MIFSRSFLYTMLTAITCLHLSSAQTPTEADIPDNIVPAPTANVIQIETTPLPKLKHQVSVYRLPSNALMDAFGLPMFVPIEKTAKKTDDQQADIAGGEIGRIVNRISINGILPEHEIIIETYIVPLGGSFAVKVKENETVLLHIKEINASYVTFGWSKDNASYRYVLPEKDDDESYIESITPKRKNKRS